MEQICCILDMDGFCVNVWDESGVTYKSEFFLRELGFVKIKGNKKFYPCSYRFDLRGHLNLQSCSANDKRTVKHQSKKILGLPLFPAPKERPMDYVGRFDLLNYIYKSFKNDKSNVVAYKGGHIEKDYLEKLGIPHVNLEKFGCPKYEDLLKLYNDCPKNCGHHTLASKDMVVHCAESEVHVYRDWFIKNFEEFKSDGACGPSAGASHPSSSACYSWDQCSSSSSD